MYASQNHSAAPSDPIHTGTSIGSRVYGIMGPRVSPRSRNIIDRQAQQYVRGLKLED